MTLSVLVITCVFLQKVNFKLQKISVRSQKLCLTIPKMLPDNKLSIISTNSNCQATFLGSFLRSQKLCLTINYPSSLFKTIVRQHFWDIFQDPKNYAWQDMSRVMGSSLSGTIFGIPEIMPDNCQATYLGSSGIIFGMSRLFLGYKNKPKQGNQGCFRAFKGVFCTLLCQSVLYKST